MQEAYRNKVKETGAGPDEGPPQAPLIPSLTASRSLTHVPATIMLTICPAATKELNTLDRMAHPDVKVGDTAHSGLDGCEVTMRGSSGMTHRKETAIKSWDSGAPLFPVPERK